MKKKSQEESLANGKIDKADLAKQVDLFWAVADVYCIEKHLCHSLMIMPKEERKKYFELYNEVRKIRAKLLKRLARNTKWDLWCPNKHFVGAVMQVMEVAIKEKYMGNDQEAIELTKLAEDLFNLFWILQEMGDKKKG